MHSSEFLAHLYVAGDREFYARFEKEINEVKNTDWIKNINDREKRIELEAMGLVSMFSKNDMEYIAYRFAQYMRVDGVDEKTEDPIAVPAEIPRCEAPARVKPRRNPVTGGFNTFREKTRAERKRKMCCEVLAYTYNRRGNRVLVENMTIKELRDLYLLNTYRERYVCVYVALLKMGILDEINVILTLNHIKELAKKYSSALFDDIDQTKQWVHDFIRNIY